MKTITAKNPIARQNKAKKNYQTNEETKINTNQLIISEINQYKMNDERVIIVLEVPPKTSP